MESLTTNFSSLKIKKSLKKSAQSKKDDKYTPDILRIRYNMYRDNYIKTMEIIKETALPIRHQNPPEDITENIVKFIIINYDNDPSCKWAKGIDMKGDLYSDKNPKDDPVFQSIFFRGHMISQ